MAKDEGKMDTAPDKAGDKEEKGEKKEAVVKEEELVNTHPLLVVWLSVTPPPYPSPITYPIFCHIITSVFACPVAWHVCSLQVVKLHGASDDAPY